MGDRWSYAGTRPVRVGNVSGSYSDPGYQIYRQATRGDVDFLTGDYLAEMNIADHAQAYERGEHDGWEQSAWEGLEMTMEVINEKRIKVIINGGAQNPSGLARKCQQLISKKGYNLKVAYVYGDDLKDHVRSQFEEQKILPDHLDSVNKDVSVADNTLDLLDTKGKPIVSANAYLGARGIVKGLDIGADIIICGRVADASPIIGAAWWWFKWSETKYDQLAGALIAGHLLECSAYVTGANFSGFNEYPPEIFVNLPFPVAEIAADGSSVITKPDGTNGLVNEDSCRSQFLYELQGTIYLNSDVSADTKDIIIRQAGPNRVGISNVRGYPPPPTTKLAIFYHGGYQSQFLANITGYATAEKFKLFEAQVRYFIQLRGYTDKFQFLDFQTIGTPAADPEDQCSSTTYIRVFAQADTKEALHGLLRSIQDHGQQHFAGFHLSLDLRTAVPIPYLAFYPALLPLNDLKEGVSLLSENGEVLRTENTGHPSKYQKLERRDNYETKNPIPLSSFGKTGRVRLGDIAQARSGDKGANINIRFFVRRSEHYPWLQSFLTRAKMQELMGRDWKDSYFIERVEFPNILAVHFVIYGPLGRGVSSARRLDALGKGFAEYVRDKVVEVPETFLEDLPSIKRERLSWL